MTWLLLLIYLLGSVLSLLIVRYKYMNRYSFRDAHPVSLILVGLLSWIVVLEFLYIEITED